MLREAADRRNSCYFSWRLKGRWLIFRTVTLSSWKTLLKILRFMFPLTGGVLHFSFLLHFFSIFTIQLYFELIDEELIIRDKGPQIFFLYWFIYTQSSNGQLAREFDQEIILNSLLYVYKITNELMSLSIRWQSVIIKTV